MTSRRHGLRSEKGQGLVEFALLLPIFVLIVVGVIQFGFALNYWLDLNNTAHTAARAAAVNRYPGCTTGTTECSVPNTFGAFVIGDLNSGALKVGGSRAADVDVCYRDLQVPSSLSVGDAIDVTVRTPYKWLAFIDTTLKGNATMRVEVLPDRVSDPGTPPTGLGTAIPVCT